METQKTEKIKEICSDRTWLSYRLQSLPSSKFIQVVDSILNGEDILLRPLEEVQRKAIK